MSQEDMLINKIVLTFREIVLISNRFIKRRAGIYLGSSTVLGALHVSELLLLFYG